MEWKIFQLFKIELEISIYFSVISIKSNFNLTVFYKDVLSSKQNYFICSIYTTYIIIQK